MNILDLLKDQLGGQIAGQLGGMLGEPEDKTKGAMDGMLGSILGGLLGKASSKEGAEDLSKQLDSQDGGLLDSIGDIFGGGKTEEVASSGSSILGSLLGDKLGGVGDLLSKASGMKSGSVMSMLGVLAPLVMSFLAKMKQSQGLDSGGFASMLMSQKDNIGAAMPEGMSGALGLKEGLFDKAAGAVSGAAASVTGAANAGADAVGNAAGAAGDAAAQGAQSAGNLLRILLPIIIVGVLGFFAYDYIFSGAKDEDPVAKPQPRPSNLVAFGGGAPPAAPVVPEVSGLAAIPGLGDMAGQFTDVFGGAEQALGSVTDEASATEAASKLGDLTGKLDGLSSGFSALPEEAKTGLLAHVTSTVLPALTSAFDKAKAIPGVEAILQPVIDTMMEKLKGFGA